MFGTLVGIEITVFWHGGIIKEGDAVCGASLKPLQLHNHSTSEGNMEVVDRLENV